MISVYKLQFWLIKKTIYSFLSWTRCNSAIFSFRFMIQKDLLSGFFLFLSSLRLILSPRGHFRNFHVVSLPSMEEADYLWVSSVCLHPVWGFCSIYKSLHKVLEADNGHHPLQEQPSWSSWSGIGCHWSLEKKPISLSRRYDQGPRSLLREITGVTNLIMSG